MTILPLLASAQYAQQLWMSSENFHYRNFSHNPACLAAPQAQPSMKKWRWAAQDGERGFHHNTGHWDRLRLIIAAVGHQDPGDEGQAPGSSKPRTI
jgi:hypothetical protein